MASFTPKTNGILLPKEHQITLPFQLETTGEKVKVEENCLSQKKVKVEENCELPWDALDIISKTLELDDHFQFSSVCKNWRAFHKIYWTSFLASQEPLLLQLSYRNESLSFISIPDQKVYCSNMTKKYFYPHPYIMSSSGYLITMDSNNSFLLINPFTRTKKVTNPITFHYNPVSYYALLAFDKCSEEFVLVVLCRLNESLHVYQSRNCGWVTYSPTMRILEKIVDFVVLHNIIYVVTNTGNIGILCLNSANIKFLKFNNTSDVEFCFDIKLVNCDEQLLVVMLWRKEIWNVYKVDFSTMNYVKMETLGDIALFYADEKHCYALSKANMWGYESNSMYAVGSYSTKYSLYLPEVFSGGDKKLQKYFTLPAHLVGTGIAGYFPRDWYFRHLKYEVDYSLVE
ncbi:uncharacterized protein LOC123902794 isoform X1 [Trifolium pratense]|uniref:uncharacterized protein LOC123902794 isoform X1 n=1 Tax=Trifolium pratense TaxID=57577 RepID=UPI001E695DB6|nr:uncharacterized protein LOC123902794 isoform X1 [Trifolium pratense]